MRYFVLLRNPYNNVRFALVESSDQNVAMFDTYDAAEKGAKRTLFGGAGHYEIFSLGDAQ